MGEFKRFFAEIEGNIAKISGDEARHALTVLRISKGDKIICINNTDFEYDCQVTDISKTQIVANILETKKSINESRHKITLITGFLKGDKTELIVQKATELGVYKIVVFESANKSAYLSPAKLNRLNKVAKEAAKQCGRSKTPEICGEKSLEEALLHGQDCKTKLFAYELASGSDIRLSMALGDTAIVCGSEGGFTAYEHKVAQKLGYSTVSLGNRILRAETAAIALCSITAFLNLDLKKTI